MAATTRADWAERRLRTAILTGELAPGGRHPDRHPRGRVAPQPDPPARGRSGCVSRSRARPPRAAARSHGRRDLARGDRRHLELGLLFEPRALRLSLHRRDWAWRADVEAAWSALRQAWGDAERAPPDIEPAHTAFHEALSAGCANAELLRLTRRLAAQSMRILLLAIAQGRIAGPTLADHAELHAACVEGDVEDAMRVRGWRASGARWRRGSARTPCARSGRGSPRPAAGTRSSRRSCMRSREQELLREAAARLATLDLYPRPVRTGRVPVVRRAWFFRLPSWAPTATSSGRSSSCAGRSTRSPRTS